MIGDRSSDSCFEDVAKAFTLPNIDSSVFLARQSARSTNGMKFSLSKMQSAASVFRNGMIVSDGGLLPELPPLYDFA